MLSAVHFSYAGAIQSCAKFTVSDKLSDGTCLQAAAQDGEKPGQAAQYDRLELSREQSQVTLNAPDEISVEIPRAWTITREAFEGWNQHLQSSLEKADRMNLSFGERLAFLKEDGRNWVNHIRQNDPELFAAWLEINRSAIEQGEADLVGLPADFTMEDYFSYVEKPFSTLA